MKLPRPPRVPLSLLIVVSGLILANCAVEPSSGRPQRSQVSRAEAKRSQTSSPLVPKSGTSITTLAPMEPSPMDRSTQAVLSILTLAVDRFFAIDSDTTASLSRDVAAALQPTPLSAPPAAQREASPELRVINVPATIDWNTQSTFPLLLAESRSRQREWEVDPKKNRQVVVVGLDHPGVEIFAPVEYGRRMPVLEPSRTGPKPDGFQATLSSVTVHHHNLLEWLDRSRLEGRIAVTLIEFDLRSNTVLTRIKGAMSSTQQRGDQTTQPIATAKTVSGTMANYGLEFSLAGPDEPLMLRIRLRMPRQELEEVRLLSASTADAPRIAASLILVRLDEPTAQSLEFQIHCPSTGAEYIELDAVLDVQTWLGQLGEGQAYVVVGQRVSGPQPWTPRRPR